MDKKILTPCVIGSLLLLSSCSQEGPQGMLSKDSNRIYFRSYLPTVTQTRAEVIEAKNFTSAQVTCINPDDNDNINPETGLINPYFENIRFEKEADGRFLSDGDNVCRWPNTESTLHFFAYYPAVDSMRKAAPEGTFDLVNNSYIHDSDTTIAYRLENFRVAKDIADQSDFLTAYTTGTLTKNSETGIKLDFKHHLARVDLSAWSGSEKYDFEIAGVRIGNPLVEADFDFTAIMNASSNANPWQNKVKQETVEHIYSPGETIVKLSKKSNLSATEASASSIMGNAGPAMVLPMSERIEAWEGKADPNTANANYSTDKMYFSVLLRVINKDGEVAYPYPNDRDGMTVIYLAVNKEGKVTKRLYKIDDEYYTSSEKSESNLYAPSAEESVSGFGWAALPVPANWEAGKIYSYKLNYTEGIGWHDPEDPKPGEPIIERGKIPFSVSVEEWTPADDYDPNLNVPKK